MSWSQWYNSDVVQSTAVATSPMYVFIHLIPLFVRFKLLKRF